MAAETAIKLMATNKRRLTKVNLDEVELTKISIESVIGVECFRIESG